MATRVVKNSELPRDPRQEHSRDRGSPMHLCSEQRRDVGEQAQRHPFQYEDVTIVVGEDDADDADAPEHEDVEEAGAADQELRRIRHRGEIGSDVYRIRDEQQRHDHPQQPTGIVPAQISSDAVTRGAADARADLLDRCHQRVGQQHGPADVETELRPGLAVGADSGRMSSEAPVIRPGPSTPRKRRNAPCFFVPELDTLLVLTGLTWSGERNRRPVLSPIAEVSSVLRSGVPHRPTDRRFFNPDASGRRDRPRPF